MPSTGLLSKQPAHALEDTVLLGVVGVILAGNFENGGEGVGEGVYTVTDAFCDLLRCQIDIKQLLQDRAVCGDKHVG